MESELFEKIKQFIVRQVGDEYLPITRETELRAHLKIDGDDADEFLIAFGKTFSVNISQFPIGDYFNSEGNVLWFALFEWIMCRWCLLGERQNAPLIKGARFELKKLQQCAIRFIFAFKMPFKIKSD
jgi:hypothetical protein